MPVYFGTASFLRCFIPQKFSLILEYYFQKLNASCLANQSPNVGLKNLILLQRNCNLFSCRSRGDTIVKCWGRIYKMAGESV